MPLSYFTISKDKVTEEA